MPTADVGVSLMDEFGNEVASFDYFLDAGDRPIFDSEVLRSKLANAAAKVFPRGDHTVHATITVYYIGDGFGGYEEPFGGEVAIKGVDVDKIVADKQEFWWRLRMELSKIFVKSTP